ncbi:hypothetical protein F5I97DRAFT_842163 [Phlebopus sp. FC_14]|nr:hypothetical protein F5I97DRAFT_842163 [Phlebopus sp. FC_14]
MVKSNTSSGKKQPMCQTCHRPTLGHPRRGRKFTCVTESSDSSASPLPESDSLRLSTPLPSPPSSPPAMTPSPSPETPRQGFQLPQGDTWHWRNPNWVSPPPPKWRLHSPSDLDRVSPAPTEPLTEVPDNEWGSHVVPDTVVEESEPADDASLYGDNDENPDEFSLNPSPRSWSPFSQLAERDTNLKNVFRGSTPLFNVFRTPCEHLANVRRTAEQEGKYVGVIKAPAAHSGTAQIPKEKADGTVWVVVSDRQEDLDYAIDSQQRGMPGTFFQKEHYGIGLLHVAFAGVLGGIVVLLGLAYL